MKESMANSAILGIVITFFAVLIALLATSSAYSKAYKVKNRIIQMIEENNGFEDGNLTRDDFVASLEDELSNYGYRINTYLTPTCATEKGKDIDGSAKGILLSFTSKYNYCVYEYETIRGTYYGVVTYMYFDIPLLDGIKIPIYGETKTLYDLSSY
ncbi:MAG: hypothetical protein PHD02_01625 [Bacilli bacterium]|nr:hypothetical protein [Bacilli bacterium]